MIITPVSSSSTVVSYTGTPGSFTAAMVAQKFYSFNATTNCWIKQGTAPTASAASGSLYVPIGATVYLDGTVGPDLSVIQDSAGGKATLAGVKTY